MPGIRVGYLVVTGQHHQPLVERKLLSDLHVSTVSQAIVSEYLASGHYRHHLAHLQIQHRQSRNAMLSALQRHSALSILDCSQWRDLSLGTIARQSTNVGNLPASLITEYHCGGNTIFPGQGYPALPEFYPLAR